MLPILIGYIFIFIIHQILTQHAKSFILVTISPVFCRHCGHLFLTSFTWYLTFIAKAKHFISQAIHIFGISRNITKSRKIIQPGWLGSLEHQYSDSVEYSLYKRWIKSPLGQNNHKIFGEHIAVDCDMTPPKWLSEI